jgi:hypothetical protein
MEEGPNNLAKFSMLKPPSRRPTGERVAESLFKSRIESGIRDPLTRIYDEHKVPASYAKIAPHRRLALEGQIPCPTHTGSQPISTS